MARIQHLLILLLLAACGSRTLTIGRDASGFKDSTDSDQATQAEVLADTAVVADLASNRDSFGTETVDTPTTDSKVGDATFDVHDEAILDLRPGDALIADSPYDTAHDVNISDGAIDMPSLDAPPMLDAPPVSIDGVPASFCQGILTRMLFNGATSTPAPSNRMMALDCCDAGRIEVISATLDHQLIIAWRHELGSGGAGYPAMIDLAKPPSNWLVEVLIDCDPMRGSCPAPPDSYTTGLSGTLQVSTGSSGFVLSLCLHVEESASSPHPILHTLDLYAPRIQTY